MNHILYKDGILKAKPFKRLPWSTPRHKGKDMFPYIGPESSITLTRNSVDDPLVVTAAGWTYELREDDFDIGFEIAIVDPEGRHTDTG
jgi:hypothetical protein